MRLTTTLARATGAALLLVLLAAAPALADTATETAGFAGKLPDQVAINSVYVFIAAILVIFMQAGFAMLEIGFVRGKNAGSVVAKILVNVAIAGIGWWAIGFGFAFGGDGALLGTHGLFLAGDDVSKHFALAYPTKANGVSLETLWLFQFGFCAVTLAIVWGTTLERIKFGVYVAYAIVFSTFIYPVVAHWIFGGGWLQTDIHVQDFAGSIVIDVTGAAAGLAVLLLLGSRRGKFGPDGKPRAIPGHNMPLFGLGVMILWLGWFGFNAGSALGALDGRFGTIAMITQLAGGAGVLTAMLVMYYKTKTFDIGMAGNGAIAGLVAVTGPAGYIEPWAAPLIGGVAGVIVVYGVLLIEKRLDDPVGALAAHGICGVWGALACGLFTSPRLAAVNLPGSQGGLFYTGSLTQLGSQALGVTVIFLFVFVSSYVVFWVIKVTYGLRVTAAEENAGLDISEHGMYGYPEQFIPASELFGSGSTPLSDPELGATV
ncbi:Ammonium transporter [Paraconexibacter sp. AEG42_29]|uniref:Ammonium transporter n=1 Tax=Paraconexibacter sp. AEG42_29 TaxID=2997339 RepID=A0AAU7ARD9_9ACTN